MLAPIENIFFFSSTYVIDHLSFAHKNSVLCRTLFQFLLKSLVLKNTCLLLIATLNFQVNILMGVRWWSRCGFICISLMISYVEYVFIYLLVICMSSLEKYLLKSFAHVSVGLFFCYIVEGVPYMFWILTPYQICGLKIFPPIPQVAFHSKLFPLLCRRFLAWGSPSCLFLLLLPVLLTKVLIFMQSNLLSFFLLIVLLVWYLRIYWSKVMKTYPYIFF